MRNSKQTWIRALVVLGLMFALILSAATAFAELSEAEKQALEAEKKAAELALEAEKKAAENQGGGGNQGQGGNQVEVPAPPEAPEPAPPPEQEMTEAEKKALEAIKKAAENQGGGQDQGQNQGQNGNQAATDRLNGRIYAFGSDFITVGIIGNNTFSVTNRTYITYNGQPWTLRWGLFVGDTVSVQFDPATNEAIRIEAEGYGMPAIYQHSDTTITYIGRIGHWPYDWGMHTAWGAAAKLGPATQVTINGVPATYQDLQVGDRIAYAESSVDLKALWIIVTR